jgi:hypothetical protein
MEALRGLTPTARSARDCNCTKVTKNGAKAWARAGRGGRVGREAGTSCVDVASISAGEVKAEELDSRRVPALGENFVTFCP